ncbi:MAG: DUF1176 domain-containing protein [Pseudolabrys sp.]|nr:DUF1176 domain-containing protein [Pseudolabrys sp.]MBV9955934.1 DUF1176 domain-containing protein [Pseudolabrys sp.]
MRALAAVLLLTASAQAQDVTLSRDTVEEAFKKAECRTEVGEALANAEPFDLEKGYRLYALTCWQSDYQSGSVLFLRDGAGRARPLTFQHWTGKKFEPSLVLAEVDFVPQSGTLTSFNKGNAQAECGQIGTWHWTGSEFKMTGYWYKERCDGYQLEGQKRYRIR